MTRVSGSCIILTTLNADVMLKHDYGGVPGSLNRVLLDYVISGISKGPLLSIHNQICKQTLIPSSGS